MRKGQSEQRAVPMLHRWPRRRGPSSLAHLALQGSLAAYLSDACSRPRPQRSTPRSYAPVDHNQPSLHQRHTPGFGEMKEVLSAKVEIREIAHSMQRRSPESRGKQVPPWESESEIPCACRRVRCRENEKQLLLGTARCGVSTCGPRPASLLACMSALATASRGRHCRGERLD